MSAPVLSTAASGILRGLIARSGASRGEVLLTGVRSVDWRSLTFDGERHEIGLRFTGPMAGAESERMLDRLGDHEFTLSGAIVADIAVTAKSASPDGSVGVAIEALTIASR